MTGTRSYTGYSPDGSTLVRDYTARLQEMLSRPAVILPDQPTSREPRESEQRRVERAITMAASEGDDNLVGYVSNYRAKVNKIVNLAQLGEDNFGEAQELYTALVDTSTEFQNDLTRLKGYRGFGGALTNEVANNADLLGSGEFNQTQVRLPDGTTTTLGSLFGGAGHQANQIRKLRERGFTPRTLRALETAETPNDPQSEALRVFTSADAQKMNDARASHAADYLAEHYDDISETLGHSATRRLAQAAVEICGPSGGGAVPFMQTMMKTVKAYRDKHDGSISEDKAWELVNGSAQVLQGLLQQSTQTPQGTANVSDNQKQVNLAVGLQVIEALNGEELLPFNDPRIGSAFTNVAGLFARAESARYNLMDLFRESGAQLSEAVRSYIKVTADGSPPPPDNPLTNLIGLRSQVNRMIVADVGAVPVAPSGTMSSDYMSANPADVTGFKSHSPTLDHMAKQIGDGVDRALSTCLIRDKKRPDDALKGILNELKHAGVFNIAHEVTDSSLSTEANALYSSLTKTVRDNVPGAGASGLDKLFAGLVLYQLRDNPAGQVSISEVFKSIADGTVDKTVVDYMFGDPSRDRDRDRDREKTFNRIRELATVWYVGAVDQPFRKEANAIRTLAQDKAFGHGMPPADADRLVSDLVTQATTLARKGDFDSAYKLLHDAATNGYVYKLEKEDDPNSRVIKAQGTVDYTNPTERLKQVQLFHRYQTEQRVATSAAIAAAKRAHSSEDSSWDVGSAK